MDVFLWCVSTQGRFTNAKYEELVLLKNIFGNGIVKHMILVFTSGGPEPEFEFLSSTAALDKVRGELGTTRFTHSEIKAYPGQSETALRNASRERVLDCVLRLSEDNGRRKYNAADAMKDIKDLLRVVGGFPEGTSKDAARTYFVEFLRGRQSRPQAIENIRPLAEDEDR